ncbi:MAG: V4R domain-containing protein [Candidatus Hermodarchaeota archaeon]
MLPVKDPISIVIFSKKPCPACDSTMERLNRIIKLAERSYGEGVCQVTIYDVKSQHEMAANRDVSSLPIVLFDSKEVISSGMASELLAMSSRASKSPLGEIPGLEGFEMMGEEMSTGLVDFGLQAQDLLYDTLFNAIIQAYDAKKELLQRRADERRLLGYWIVEKTLDTQYLGSKPPIREDLGDYVHIGIVQQIILSLLSLSDVAGNFLHRGGRDLGMYGVGQTILPIIYPQIHQIRTSTEAFREAVHGLQVLYNRNQFPLHITDSAKIIELSKSHAKLRINGSAYAAGVKNVGETLCYLLAGEMEGIVETVMGEAVSVRETKCWGTGSDYCEFEIQLGEQSLPVSQVQKSADSRMPLFEERLGIVSKNMAESLRMKKPLREVGDFVHICALQQALASFKVSDPFSSTLLYFAGNRFGSMGADKYTLMKIVNYNIQKKNLQFPFEFDDAIFLLSESLRYPSVTLARSHGAVEYEITDDEEAELRIYENASAAGLQITFPPELGERPKDFLRPVEKLCDFTSGFIAGRIKVLMGAEPTVKETHCHGSGDSFCQFYIEVE